MEDQLRFLSPDGSSIRNGPERSPRPLYSQHSTQEDHYQKENLIIVKVEVKEEAEEAHEMDNQQSLEEEEKISQEVSSDCRSATVTWRNGRTSEEEETFMRIKEEDILIEISADGKYAQNNMSMYPQNNEIEDDDITANRPEKNLITLNLANPSTHGGCSHPVSHCGSQKSSKRPHCCSVCGKCFPRRSHLVKHERVHTGEKPFACTECGKCFSDKSVLITHIRVHIGEKPYSCSTCGKCFSYRSVLLKHERIHIEEKPYCCSECGKGFSQKTQLIIHTRVHTGEKPYACSECGQSFSQKPNLIKHIRIHTGAKPYSCSACGKSFAVRSNLTAHLKTHEGKKSLSCSDCGRHFSKRSALTIHQKWCMGPKQIYLLKALPTDPFSSHSSEPAAEKAQLLGCDS